MRGRRTFMQAPNNEPRFVSIGIPAAAKAADDGGMGGVDARTLKKYMRGGIRVEVGEPFAVRGASRYMCLAKVVGRTYRIRRVGDPREVPEEPDPTQTLCIVSEEGATPEEARRRLLARLEKARMTPTVRPPERPRRGWLGRLISVFK